jgi:hypothetical protein
LLIRKHIIAYLKIIKLLESDPNLAGGA